MKYWGESSDSHIQFSQTPFYQRFRAVREDINEEGYYGDTLRSSDVVFLGTCDVMSAVSHSDHHWARKIHASLHPTSPFIALGSIGVGLPTMVRRLFSYIENYGPPKHLYMTVPRFDGYEFVLESGKCYNASTRSKSASYMHSVGGVTDKEYEIWQAQLSTNKKALHKLQIQYMLEERFSFIETICKLHQIDLKWSFNLSDASIITLFNNLETIRNISTFMQKSFVGLAPIMDIEEEDHTIGPLTHSEIFNKFTNPSVWDFEDTNRQSLANINWLKLRYGTATISGEDA